MNTHLFDSIFLQFFRRQKFPRLESKNVQFWFKNRRAKCKRLKLSLYDNVTQMNEMNNFAPKYDERD